MTDPAARTSDAPGRGLWVGLLLGVPVLAWGIRGLFAASARVHPPELARWIVGAAVVHDLVVIPVTLAVGLGLRRIVPPTAWPPVRWALAATAVVTVIAGRSSGAMAAPRRCPPCSTATMAGASLPSWA